MNEDTLSPNGVMCACKRVRSMGGAPRRRLLSAAALLVAASPALALRADNDVFVEVPKVQAAPWLQGDESECFHTKDVDWVSDGGRVYVRDGRGNAHVVRIRGVTWPGMDTSARALEGLDITDMESILEALVSLKVNAVRVPLSLDMALSLPEAEAKRTDICAQTETTSAQLHRLLMRAAGHGILVMFDMHRLHAAGAPGGGPSDPAKFSVDQFLLGWDSLLKEFGEHPNLFAIDAFDGPLFSAQWTTRGVDHANLLKRLARDLLAKHPGYRGLLGLKPVREKEARLADHLGAKQWADRVVYTPHIVGSLSAASDPRSLPPLMDATFGHLEADHHHALLAVEWGGPLVDTPELRDATRCNVLAEWMRTHGATDAFWSLSPNEAGLLLADWETVAECRVELLARVAPRPTRFGHFDRDEWCVTAWGGDACSDEEDTCTPNYTGLECSKPGSKCITCNNLPKVSAPGIGQRTRPCREGAYYGTRNLVDAQTMLTPRRKKFGIAKGGGVRRMLTHGDWEEDGGVPLADGL